MSEFEGDRIAKVIARAGLCSRRDAERLIGEGRVKLNGKVLTTAATNVTAKDVVLVDNLPLPQKEETRLWRYHKPAGLVVSNRDPKGRPTVFQKLREQLPRVLSIGRLDINTEGLLLLTNDGELARFLELPATGWIRRYRVRAFGRIEEAALKRIENGRGDRRRALWPGRGEDRARPGRQQLAHHRHQGRQEPRSEAHLRASGTAGEQADPHRFRAVPAG
jgi:23S rRNA pseudouridine2605 synthase